MRNNKTSRRTSAVVNFCYICGSVAVLIVGISIIISSIKNFGSKLPNNMITSDTKDAQTQLYTTQELAQYACNEFVFRDGIVFNMTKSEVLQNETAQMISDQGDSVLYSMNYICPDDILLYTFRNNSLFSMMYTFGIRYTDYNKYIEDFYSVNEWMCAKYGIPTTDEVTWRDNSFRGIISNDVALAEGDIMYMTVWNGIGNATITHFMFLKDNVILHCVLYTPTQS